MKTLRLIFIVWKYMFFMVFFVNFYDSFAQEDHTKYIDPTIGNEVPFLVPTHSTFHLPNQMIRMFPVKQDCISDQIEAFHFQVPSHREAGILQMKVSIGSVLKSSWSQKMNIDHGLDKSKPWLYSTFLIDNTISVSFTLGKKTVLYKLDFPTESIKNLLIKGTGEMTVISNKDQSFSFEEKIKYTTKGISPLTRIMSAYMNAIIIDNKNQT